MSKYRPQRWSPHGLEFAQRVATSDLQLAKCMTMHALKGLTRARSVATYASI